MNTSETITAIGLGAFTRRVAAATSAMKHLSSRESCRVLNRTRLGVDWEGSTKRDLSIAIAKEGYGLKVDDAVRALMSTSRCIMPFSGCRWFDHGLCEDYLTFPNSEKAPCNCIPQSTRRQQFNRAMKLQ